MSRLALTLCALICTGVMICTWSLVISDWTILDALQYSDEKLDLIRNLLQFIFFLITLVLLITAIVLAVLATEKKDPSKE